MSQIEEAPSGTLERRVAHVVSVAYPERTLELVVVPYESETAVAHEGRMIREVFSRGAFDGIERRANRIRVNRDHEINRPVGRVVAFHPSRDEGLVAEVRIARTELGEETLTLADEGILDASAAFLPMPGGETWEDRRRLRRITKAWLGHVALTPDPAYEDARVLAVRQAQRVASQTPNLDLVRAWRLEDLVASDPALNR